MHSKSETAYLDMLCKLSKRGREQKKETGRRERRQTEKRVNDVRVLLHGYVHC